MHCFDKTFESEQGEDEFKWDASHPFSPSDLQGSGLADGEILFALLGDRGAKRHRCFPMECKSVGWLQDGVDFRSGNPASSWLQRERMPFSPLQVTVNTQDVFYFWPTPSYLISKFSPQTFRFFLAREVQILTLRSKWSRHEFGFRCLWNVQYLTQ